MSCGIPVVTTRCGAIPEVVRDAAEVVNDPYSDEEWCAAIGELARTTERLRDLSDRGRRRAKELSWDLARERFIGIVEKPSSQ
jgi:glycosyltransferase involved in cell wall biosynthesis